MGLMIGVDGGGSGCRVIVADAAGTILARADGGPANIATDPEGALRSILECSEMAVREALGSAASSELRFAHAGLGLAGAKEMASEIDLQEGFGHGGKFASMRWLVIRKEKAPAAAGAFDFSAPSWVPGPWERPKPGPCR